MVRIDPMEITLIIKDDIMNENKLHLYKPPRIYLERWFMVTQDVLLLPQSQSIRDIESTISTKLDKIKPKCFKSEETHIWPRLEKSHHKFQSRHGKQVIMDLINDPPESDGVDSVKVVDMLS